MKDRHIFPPRDAEFSLYLYRVVNYLYGTEDPAEPPRELPENTIRLGVADHYIKSLWTLFSEWYKVFPKSQNPDERTKAITLRKNMLRDEIEEMLRSLYRDIPESGLLPDDRETFNLKERDVHPTPVPEADHAPNAEIERIEHLVQTLRITNPANPNSRSMPKGQKVSLERFVGNPGLVEAAVPFTGAQLVTKFLHRVKFNAADIGKTVYYRFRYVSTRGLYGPWSRVLSAVVA